MSENLTPRQIVKRLLQEGVQPSRPLFLPVVFSLGAKVENVPLRAFLENPTKISNSLRQIRGHLRSDGVACYFHPRLAAEALGGVPQWHTENGPLAIEWPQHACQGELPRGLRSPQEAAQSGRVKIAAEVIRRLNLLLSDGCLLMAGITGPVTLAAEITQLASEPALKYEDLPEAALELAASTITRISTAFVEAGANSIFIQEEILPCLSGEACEAWASLLSPTFNIVRFYEALPVLQVNAPSFAQNFDMMSRVQWDCILCPALHGTPHAALRAMSGLNATAVGIALPIAAFDSQLGADEGLDEWFRMIVQLKPAVLTTADDLPPTTDMKRLLRLLEEVRR